MQLLLLLVGCPPGGFIGEIGIDSGPSCFVDDTTGRLAGSYTPSGCHFMLVGDSRHEESRIVLDVPAFVTLHEGEPVDVTYTLPDPTVRLDLEVGCDLSADWCEDDERTALVAEVYEGASGTIAITGTPDGDEAVVTAVLTNIGFFHPAEPEAVTTLESLTWTDVRLTGP